MSTVASTVREYIDQLGYGDPQYCRNLLFVPLLLRNGNEHPGVYLPVLEALRTEKVRIEETQQVPQLDIHNLSDTPVFIPLGCYLRGGGQDRMVAASVVVSAHASGKIPVRCVERQRWNPTRGATFHTPDTGSMAGSTVVMKRDQQDTVWDTVGSLQEATGTQSRSFRHGDSYVQSSGSLAEFRSAVSLERVQGHVVGSICAVRGPARHEHWAVDLFGQEALFRAFFPGILESVALTALSVECTYDTEYRAEHAHRSATHEFMVQALRHATLDPEPIDVNHGTFSTGTSHQKVGVSLLEDEGHILHAMARWDIG